MRTRVIFLRPLLIAVVLAMPACANSARPEATVRRFIQAFNDKDLNNLLACVDPQQERMFRASFRLVDRFTGGLLPLEDLLELVPGLYQVFQGRLSSDFRLRDIRVYKAKISGDEAEVTVLLTASMQSGRVQKDERQQLRFILRQFDEGWRIVSVQQ